MITARYNEPPDEPTIQRIAGLEALIRNSTFDHDTQSQMERSLTVMTETEMTELEIELWNNQLDPINERGLFSPTDIKNMKI